MTTDEYKLYHLICSSYIAQFFPSYEYDKTSIEISASGELFTSSINVEVNLGWKVVMNDQATPKQKELKQTESRQTELRQTEPQQTALEQTVLRQAEAKQTGLEQKELKQVALEQTEEKQIKSKQTKQNPVPNLALGQALSIDSIDLKTKQTKPPARYTEGSLIAAMEKAHLFVTDPNLKKVLKGNEGIGTEATRANIIDLLKKRHFLSINKKQLISSATGRALIAAVPNAVKDPGMTAIMESSLSKIATGDLSLDAFMDWQVNWLNQLIEAIKSRPINIQATAKIVACPDCGKDLFLRQGKQGFFWSCQGYFETPKCAFMTQDKAGKPVFK